MYCYPRLCVCVCVCVFVPTCVSGRARAFPGAHVASSEHTCLSLHVRAYVHARACLIAGKDEHRCAGFALRRLHFTWISLKTTPR